MKTLCLFSIMLSVVVTTSAQKPSDYYDGDNGNGDNGNGANYEYDGDKEDGGGGDSAAAMMAKCRKLRPNAALTTVQTYGNICKAVCVARRRFMVTRDNGVTCGRQGNGVCIGGTCHRKQPASNTACQTLTANQNSVGYRGPRNACAVFCGVNTDQTQRHPMPASTTCGRFGGGHCQNYSCVRNSYVQPAPTTN